jgi:BatD DUF11 like domain
MIRLHCIDRMTRTATATAGATARVTNTVTTINPARLTRDVRRAFVGAFCIASSVLCHTAWAAVTASVDRTQLAAGDAVQLTLQSDHGGDSQPDVGPLAKDFEIVGRSTAKRLQINNGSVSSQREVRLTLAPRRSGRIEVPRLAWDGEQSAAIELSVAANGSAAGANDAGGSVAHVFMTATLDTLPAYVQSAVSLQVRLYSDKNLYQANLELPSNADLRVQRIGTDVTAQETRNARTYQVITRSYLLVPQRSGDITLDGPVLDAQVADGNRSARLSGQPDPFADPSFGRLPTEGGLLGSRAMRLHGDPIRLTALPRPPGWARSSSDSDSGRADWLPAQQLTLADTATSPRGAVEVGQPLTRQLRITAVGLSASQLPDLAAALSLPPGVQAHASPPTLDDTAQAGHIVGQREQTIAFVADRAGHYQLPALRVAWWDTEKKQRRETVLAALDVDVRSAAVATAAAVAAPPTTMAPSTATTATTPAAGPLASTPSATPSATPTATSTTTTATDTTTGIPSATSIAAPAAADVATAPGAATAATAASAVAEGPVVDTAIHLAPSGQAPWFWLSVGLTALWLGTAGAWLRSHRRQRQTAGHTTPARHGAAANPPAAVSEKAAHRAFQDACRNHAAGDARAALLVWARATLPHAPSGLNALARLLGNPAATPLLRELDRACFEGTAWSGDALARALPTLRGSLPPATAADALPNLYGPPDPR